MKIPGHIITRYHMVHSWLGVTTGLLLFVSFFAGAFSVFEEPLRTATSPAISLPAPPPLEETSHLIAGVLRDIPQARKQYTIILHTDRAHPARMMWSANSFSPSMRQYLPHIYASLMPDGRIVTTQSKEAPIATLIERLHETFGLPLPYIISDYIMGAISLCYVIALFSGLIIFLPGILRNLFSVQIERRSRKTWRDFHNVLGVFSFPFHIVMGITAVAFAFHDPVYGIEKAFLAEPGRTQHSAIHHAPLQQMQSKQPIAISTLSPTEVVKIMQEKAPGFTATSLLYSSHGPNHQTIRVIGNDTRFAMRGSNFGFAEMDAHTGTLLSTAYLPGHQSIGFMILTFFFASHFGSFGGMATRIMYVILGLAGAFLFYSGNHLWIDAQRRKERANGAKCESWKLHGINTLIHGWVYGSMLGIILLVLAGLFSPATMSLSISYCLYYLSTGLVMGAIFLRGRKSYS